MKTDPENKNPIRALSHPEQSTDTNHVAMTESEVQACKDFVRTVIKEKTFERQPPVSGTVVGHQTSTPIPSTLKGVRRSFRLGVDRIKLLVKCLHIAVERYELRSLNVGSIEELRSRIMRLRQVEKALIASLRFSFQWNRLEIAGALNVLEGLDD